MANNMNRARTGPSAVLTSRCAPIVAAPKGRVTVKALEARIDELTEELRALRSRVAPTGTNEAEARGCRELVAAHAGSGEAVLVIAKGDEELLDLGRHTACFPQDRGGRYAGFSPADSVGAIAHLEALRFAGYRFLLVPESSRWWFDAYREFHDHLETTAVAIDDRDGCGRLYRLDTAAGNPPLQVLINRVADRALAICDWSDGRLGPLNQLHTVFQPPEGVTLPYLDQSIDVVVVADERRLAEARRVAQIATIMLAASGDGADIDIVAGQPCDPPIVRVVSADDEWQQRVASVLTEIDDVIVDDADAPLVLVVDPGVIPLPGCVNSARALLASGPSVGAVAVKLLDADGSIESVGDVVFADGSSASIASGSYETSAPWHEYVRDICAARGLAVVDAASHARLESAVAVRPRTTSAAVWGTGGRVVYQPAAAAVRVADDDGANDDPLGAWSVVFPDRPVRPEVLDDSAWRRLLAGQLVKP